jgi:hypothetical protein
MRTSAGIMSPGGEVDDVAHGDLLHGDLAAAGALTLHAGGRPDHSLSFAAALPERVSCTKRSVPEIITITAMMMHRHRHFYRSGAAQITSVNRETPPAPAERR